MFGFRRLREISREAVQGGGYFLPALWTFGDVPECPERHGHSLAMLCRVYWTASAMRAGQRERMRVGSWTLGDVPECPERG